MGAFFIACFSPETYLKHARWQPRQRVIFLRQSGRKEGDTVNDYIARLIDCGIPRDTAVCICHTFKRDHGLDALACYVDAVEQECHGDLEEV